MDIKIEAVILKHLAYCEGNDWAGIEPYDVLNSKIVNALPFLDYRLPRLVLTQALKRSPINIRPLLLIENTQNPKAIAVFLSALLKLVAMRLIKEQDYIEPLIQRLIALRSKDVPYWSWGYSFPWQTRTHLVPKWFPNLVCTSFAADALLDVYQERRDSRCLEMAVSAAEYILNELYWREGRCVGFSYPLPSLRAGAHNANFLAAALLCRIYKYTGEEKFLDPALQATRYSAAQQREDGSWAYGEAVTQQWVDNFHTGYNLCALRCIGRNLGTREFESFVERGFRYYRDNFFLPDGAVRYYDNRTYPIDAHCIAQSIITPLVLRDLDQRNLALADSVFRWAMAHMWDDDQGFFYYRVLRTCTIRTSYMRWTQAWMFLALTMLAAEYRLAEGRVQQSHVVHHEVSAAC